MDFTNHTTTRPNSQMERPVSAAQENDNNPKIRTKKSGVDYPKSWRIIFVVLLFSVTILLGAVILLLSYGNKNEAKYVNASDIQAVDINIAGSSPTNQLYFGHIESFVNNYVVMDDIYYFPTNSNTSSNTTSLEPLVCQIDAPYSQMIINRSNIVWWENLQNSGKVAKTISSYEHSHPKGPNCSTNTTSPVK